MGFPGMDDSTIIQLVLGLQGVTIALIYFQTRKMLLCPNGRCCLAIYPIQKVKEVKKT
jgi:hypothetical protein